MFGDRVPEVEAVQDDELYEILNKYKSDFRREKEERGRVEKELAKLKEAFEVCRV